jgi:hypothetical protein
MEESLFIEWVKKYFPGIVVSVVDTLNGTDRALTYLHRAMLRKTFSPSGKWESLSETFSIVAADVVAMDSELPLKMRDRIGKASGDIPKMGMELKLNERQLTDLDTIIAMGGSEQQVRTQVIQRLFADTPRCIAGVYERNEFIFLEGLSTGLALVEDTENVGTGIRIDYGYLSGNKFGVTALWSNTASTPMDDIQRVLNKVRTDGKTVNTIWLDRTALNNMAKTDQAKQYYAFQQGFVGANILVPSEDQLKGLVQSRFRLNIQIVDRSVTTEKNGVKTSHIPWADGRLVFTNGTNVGDLVWARTAEHNHPVAGVQYQTADDYILVAKFRQNKPSMTEVTNSQARVIPVISGVDNIYTLDSKTVQA